MKYAHERYCVRFSAILVMTILVFFCVSVDAGVLAEIPYTQFDINKENLATGNFTLLAPTSVGLEQGGCYVENGLYILCYVSSESDNLTLRCFDSNSMSFIWEKTLNGGAHGNAICFRPADRRLYIADCFSYDARCALKNSISVYDYDNLDAGVIEVIEPSTPGGIYSIAYDRGTDTFYSTNYRGFSEGSANALFSYNGVFESVKNVVYLDDYTVRYSPAHSSQGVQCVADGVAFIPYYSPAPKIVGYSVETGQPVMAENVPYTVEKKIVGELESVMYNEDDDILVALSSTALLQYGKAQTMAQRLADARVRHDEHNRRVPLLYAAETGDTALRGRWRRDGTVWYYYDSYGRRVADTELLIDGKYYRFDCDGVMLSGVWYKNGTVWYYYDENGVRAADKELRISGKYYRFDSEGVMLSGTWYQNGVHWYYYSTEGRRVNDAEIEINGSVYRFDSEGVMLAEEWYRDGPICYYYSSDGVKVIDTELKINDSVYRFDSDGVMLTDTWFTDGSCTCYYDENGCRTDGTVSKYK